MSTNQEIIDQALGKLGIVEAGDSANATDSATALNALNNFMAYWATGSLNMDWFPQDTLSDTAPLERWQLAAVIPNFAIFTATDFRVPVSGDLREEARVTKNTLMARVINTSLEPSEMSHLPLGDRYRYDIDTDR